MKNSTEIQERAVRYKADKKIEFEELRHRNIMQELEFMAKNKIKIFSRDEIRQPKLSGDKLK